MLEVMMAKINAGLGNKPK